MHSLAHLRIEQVNLVPAQEWIDESASWRFLRIGAGAAYWLGPSEPRALSEGEVVVAAPAIKAVIRASQLNQVLLHGFGLDLNLVCGFFTLGERHLIEHQSLSSRVRFLPSTHPIAQLFGELAVSGVPEPDLAKRAEVLGLVAAFFGEATPTVRRLALSPTSAHERFRQVVSHMPDVELIQHTPRELAELCHCSPRHFNRLFREFFGEPPRVKRTELRLLRAGQLLTSTDEKVNEIARDTGFKSVSLFNSLFKRRFGLSPSEFRNQPENGLGNEGISSPLNRETPCSEVKFSKAD